MKDGASLQLKDISAIAMPERQSDRPAIMIVDDAPANLQLLLKLLLSKNYRVSAFAESGEALKAAQAAPPDLFLLDIRMPDMDGFELCRRIKADPRLGDIPVLFISVIDDSPEIIRAFAEGGADYVTKPIKPQEVLARVNTHLRLSGLLRETERRKEEVEQEVARRTRELEQKSASLAQYALQLEQSNLALDVLIGKFEKERDALAQKRVEALWIDIAPMLKEMEELCETDQQKVLVEMIQSRFAQGEPKIFRLDSNPGILTKREHQVALLIAEGRTCNEAAQVLGIGLRSVHSHCYKIRKKLGIDGKVKLKTFMTNNRQ